MSVLIGRVSETREPQKDWRGVRDRGASSDGSPAGTVYILMPDGRSTSPMTTPCSEAFCDAAPGPASKPSFAAWRPDLAVQGRTADASPKVMAYPMRAMR